MLNPVSLNGFTIILRYLALATKDRVVVTTQRHVQ